MYLTVAGSLNGCVGPDFEESDPGGEIRFSALHARHGVIYAAASYYSKRDRWHTNGAVHFDAERLFVEGEPIRSPRNSDDPNLSRWGLAGRIVHREGDYAVVALSSIPSEAKVQVLRLDGLFEPFVVSETTVANESQPLVGVVSLGERGFIVTRFGTETGTHPATIYSLSADGEAAAVAASDDFNGFNCELRPDDLLYCVYLDPDAASGTHSLRVYRLNRAEGTIDFLGDTTDTGPSIDAIRAFSFIDDATVAVFGDASAPEIELFELDEQGVPAHQASLTLPGEVYVHAAVGVPGERILLATSEGVHLVDGSTLPESGAQEMTVLDTYGDTPLMISPYDESRGLYMWPLSRWGMVLVRVTPSGMIEKVGGYYRKFGDRFGSYTQLSEGKY